MNDPQPNVSAARTAIAVAAVAVLALTVAAPLWAIMGAAGIFVGGALLGEVTGPLVQDGLSEGAVLFGLLLLAVLAGASIYARLTGPSAGRPMVLATYRERATRWAQRNPWVGRRWRAGAPDAEQRCGGVALALGGARDRGAVLVGDDDRPGALLWAVEVPPVVCRCWWPHVARGGGSLHRRGAELPGLGCRRRSERRGARGSAAEAGEPGCASAWEYHPAKRAAGRALCLRDGKPRRRRRRSCCRRRWRA